MTDQELIEGLTNNNPRTIRYFFFERCRAALAYIGQYYCPERESAEELIGEFYEFLSRDDWHKLRIFQYTCSLDSYIMIIASRYFLKRRKELETASLESPGVEHKAPGVVQSDYSFFRMDLDRVVRQMPLFDRFLIERILLDGAKPHDILDEARTMIALDDKIHTSARTHEEFASYIYTRYNRARRWVEHSMRALGYGND